MSITINNDFITPDKLQFEEENLSTKVTEEDWPFGRNFLLDYSLKDKLTIWFKNLIIIIPVPTEVTHSPEDDYKKLPHYVREELEKRKKESADKN